MNSAISTDPSHRLKKLLALPRQIEDPAVINKILSYGENGYLDIMNHFVHMAISELDILAEAGKDQKYVITKTVKFEPIKIKDGFRWFHTHNKIEFSLTLLNKYKNVGGDRSYLQVQAAVNLKRNQKAMDTISDFLLFLIHGNGRRY